MLKSENKLVRHFPAPSNFIFLQCVSYALLGNVVQQKLCTIWIKFHRTCFCKVLVHKPYILSWTFWFQLVFSVCMSFLAIKPSASFWFLSNHVCDILIIFLILNFSRFCPSWNCFGRTIYSLPVETLLK